MKAEGEQQSDAVASSKCEQSASTVARRTTTTDRNALNTNVIELGTALYLCVWWSIVALHGMCALFLTQLARVHWFLEHPRMLYWTRVATGDYESRLHNMGVAFCAIGALHGWQLLSIAWESIRARELVLPDGSSSWTATLASAASHIARSIACASARVAPALQVRSRLRALAGSSSWLLQCWRFIFSHRGVFGVESELFPVVFIVRESVEVVSQTFQARRSSELLPRPWLNNLFAAVVVANCWSTPMLQRALGRQHQSQSLERVACLLVDAALNVGASMLLPLAIFWPYYATLDPVSLAFPVESMYDALWFTRITTENQLLFSLATPDVVAKLVPHLGIYTSLVCVVVLIHRRTSRRRSVRLVSTMPALVCASGSDVSIEPASQSEAVRPAVHAIARPALRRQQSAVHLFFAAWGLAVLVLHVRATMRSSDVVPGCRQATSAWFATAYPCSVYTYNCYRHGTISPDEDSWTHLDKNTLAFLTIAHCPALTMPRAFQNFPNLLAAQLHNVTLVEWRKESAISALRHPRLAALLIARTNMTRLPDGVLEPLPPRLINVQLSHTNLTALPADLHERWHALSTLFVEHSLLTEFPETLQSLRLSKLSLHGNRIERIPSRVAPATTRFLVFVLSANPLRTLPDTLSDGTTFVSFSAERTQLSVLPAWTRSRVQDTVFMYGTPFCATRTGDVRDGALVACVQRDDRVDGKAPLEIFDPRLPL